MEQWHSDRWKREKLQQDKMKIFDDFLDLALAGVVTLEQAIIGVHEVLATEAEIANA